MFLRKFFNWLFNNTNVPKNEEAAMPAAWPFPVSDHFEQAVEVTTPKVARKPKANATTSSCNANGLKRVLGFSRGSRSAAIVTTNARPSATNCTAEDVTNHHTCQASQ